jgi:response regulator NasT
VEPVRLLVADDEESVRATLVGMCEALGYQVVGQARSGDEAVALADSTSPDVILLDIRMPRMDGLEAARAISERRFVPILIVTGHTDGSFIEEAADAGVFSYLVKPISTEALAAAVSTARARFADVAHLREEVGDLKTALDARKMIERAKGVLMRDMRVGEQEAFRWLKRASSHHNQKLAEVARRIVALDNTRAG